MPGLKILITSGATREPIDDVRYITNVSTGKTGAQLASFLTEAGFEVTYARGEGAAEPLCDTRILVFSDYRSLDSLLKKELAAEKYFAVIHLAAVSDYSVESVVVGERSYSPEQLRKLDSGEELKLILKRNTKILDRLKGYSDGRSLIVGFKLTHTKDDSVQLASVGKVASSGDVDLVVHNDLGQIRGGFGHHFRLHDTRDGKVGPGKNCDGVEHLGALLVGQFKEFL